MELHLTDEEIVELKELLRANNIKISTRRIKNRWNKIANSHQIFPVIQQQAILVRLLDSYATTKKKVVILLEELGNKEIPAVFVLGVLAEDWPGMSNSILGIIHHKRRNVTFIKGFTLDYESKSLGVVILSFYVNTPSEYEEFLKEKKGIIAEIRDAAQGSTGKYHLL